MRFSEESTHSNLGTSAINSVGVRKRILFMGESVSLAHIGRPAVLARWAQEAGHEVHFACGSPYSQVARGENLDPLPLETIPPEVFYQRLGKGQFFYTAEELDRYVQAERKMLRQIKPDLVVSDFRLSLHISAKLEGVPMLALNNAHWSPGYAGHLPPPDFGIFKVLPPSPRAALFRLLRPLVYRLFAKPIDDLRQNYGLPRFNDFRKCYNAGDACAYLDNPELIPLKTIPDTHFFLGPVPWKPVLPSDTAIDKLPSDLPLAYVSMGSSGNENILPKILRVLGELGFCVVLSGVDSTRSEAWLNSIPSLRGRLFAQRSMDPESALKHAAVTVCHGGNGTVYQSLSQGVPLICIPNNPDQVMVSQTVVARGVGCLLRANSTFTRNLKTILVQKYLIEARFHQNANQMAQVLQKCDTRRNWWRWLNADLHLFRNFRFNVRSRF